jgi:hypothetical protein
MKTHHRHNSELDIMRWERGYYHTHSLRWNKQQAHRETRRNSRAIVANELLALT